MFSRRSTETTQIADIIVRACGFDSESHVSTLFRQRFGRTMRDLRRNR